MGKINIHQLIYTKLNKEDSPFKKEDFHTAFYPQNLLTNTDVLVLENNIYIPQNTDFTSKQVVYFNKIKDEIYLFVFDIRLLPNEVDQHGRGGIFIGHIFMFPEDAWKQVSSPNDLLDIVNKYKYNSREELLKSEYINKETGDMHPISIDTSTLKETNKELPRIDSVFEKKLLLHLIDHFKPENNDQVFIVKAKEPEARILFNKLICYIPNEQKINVGWDTMFDNGRMMDYNKIFAAYEKNPPRGASASTVVYPSKNTIELAKDFKETEKPDPFVKWIGACTGQAINRDSVEQAYKLSKALVQNKKCEISKDWNIDCFSKVNKDLIEKLFLEKSKKEFNKKLSKEINKIMSVNNKLLFYCDKLAVSDIVTYILKVVENGKVSASRLQKSIPGKYLEADKVLTLIKQIWDTGQFDIASFSSLPDKQKLQLNRYVLKTSVQKEKWYLELIKKDDILLKYYTRQYPNPKKIINRFRKTLNMTEKEINSLGFSLLAIRKVFYFKLAHFFRKFKKR